MIFVTVGHQTPFDRLIKAVDTWAGDHDEAEIFAQIGEGSYEPTNIEYTRWLDAPSFEAQLTRCSCVIAHAGTGTILQVLELQKPLLVMPRTAALNETRNDHQIGTAKYFAAESLVLSANDETELAQKMDEVRHWKPNRAVTRWAQPELMKRISEFIDHR